MAGCRPHKNTKCSFTYDRSGFKLLERPGQAITAGTCPAIYQHTHRACIGFCRLRVIAAMTPVKVVDDRTSQELKKTVGKLTTTIKPLINNEALLIKLTIIHTNQFPLSLT